MKRLALACASLSAGLLFAPESAGRAPAPQERSGPGRSAEAVTSATQIGGLEFQAQVLCVQSIVDQAHPGTCLEATSVPTAGRLFPAPHLGGVNNVQSGILSFVGGGRDNQAASPHGVVAGGFGNTAGGGSASTVGGGAANAASGYYATVAGGHSNEAFWYATVGGGEDNTALGFDSVVAGGVSNSVALAMARAATIGGGSHNLIGAASSFPGGGSGASYATIAGGANNTVFAPAEGGTISGGFANAAMGAFSTVPGGRTNTASGAYSFAAGRLAMAQHDGAFVWADSQNGTKASSAQDEFNVYASGGTRIFSNAAGTSGVHLDPGSGTWSSLSDRDSKQDLRPVDGREVLARLVALPISTWTYRAQERSVRHMGPMAQDFSAAFGLGADERWIDSIDPDGVALAAIQGLEARLRDREAEVEDLRTSNDELEERLAQLEAVVARLGTTPGAANR